MELWDLIREYEFAKKDFEKRKEVYEEAKKEFERKKEELVEQLSLRKWDEVVEHDGKTYSYNRSANYLEIRQIKSSLHIKVEKPEPDVPSTPTERTAEDIEGPL